MSGAGVTGLPDNVSRAEIVNAVGRGWIAGLTWRSFASYPTLGERREDAQALGAEWVVLRESFDIIQAGFCPSITKSRPKRLYSLAAAVAEEYQQPWCGVFKLSDKSWWYIAVRDGQAVLPDGDVVGDYATVLAARRRHESYGDWNIHDGALEDLLPLLEFSKKNLHLAHVRSVEPVPVWKAVLPAVLAVIILVVGVFLYQQHERQVVRAAQQAAHKVIVNMSPLRRTPEPDDWLAACAQVLQPLPVSVNGWLASNVSCTQGEANIMWGRLEGATIATRPPGLLSEDGNKVIQIRAFGQISSGADIMRAADQEDAALYNLLQPLGVQAQISKPLVDSGGGFETQDVDFTLPVPPFDIDFNEVPGLRLESLVWTESGWTLEGKLYGK